MPRHACRKDANHDEVASEFERLGCVTLDCSRYEGFVDLMVWRHQPRLVEVKTKTGKLRKSQRDLAKIWPGPIHVVRSRIEAMALVQHWDKEAEKDLPW